MTDKTKQPEARFARHLARTPLAAISRAAQRRYLSTRPASQTTRTGV